MCIIRVKKKICQSLRGPQTRELRIELLDYVIDN
jgi:hypothetical protein